MTEEEKKVFMKIKDRHEYFTRDNKFEETNDFEKECLFEIGYLTQIIEKLEKENEERKSEIEIFYKWLSFTCKELGISEDTPIIDMLNEFKNNYIPKSKIKNLKEELNNFDISFYDKETLKEAVSNSLKELFEEEQE